MVITFQDQVIIDRLNWEIITLIIEKFIKLMIKLFEKESS
jgi:hypothetical protein